MSDSLSISARGTTELSILDVRGNTTEVTLANNGAVEVGIVGGAPGPRGQTGPQGPQGPQGPSGSGAEDPGDLILYFQNGLV